MDIFNRPPAISEDTLQFSLYPTTHLSDKASVTASAACIRTYVDTLLPDFIWHRDAFELKIAPDPDSKGDRWFICGRIRVGDCVDDEWCTVWILKEISASWDLVISVWDTDGEFLLIEAAEALPSWVKPTNSENRVWIYKSRLHLVPISHISPPSRTRHRRVNPGTDEDDGDEQNILDDTSDEYISSEDAVSLVRDASVMTVAPSAVEQIVWQRVSCYPDAARFHLHTTKAYIPIDVVKALAVSPSLIQKAAEAFYTRDAVQLRSAHRMARFPPSSSVLASVKLTRTAYAQLVGQKFFPPKIFGNLQEGDKTNEWRWRDIGMKIAAGFEMLYQESKSLSKQTPFNTQTSNSVLEARKDALQRDPEYSTYIRGLISADYFKGEITGSKRWNTLENKAADIYLELRKQDSVKRPSFASQVDTALSEAPTPFILPPQLQDDPDDWLSVDPQNLDEMLEKTMKGSNSPLRGESLPEDRLASQQASKLKELADKVEDFVEREGEVEGALFDDEEFSDASLSDAESQSDLETSDFADDEAKRAALETLVPGIEPSDYGKMPSYYSNSQRVAPTTLDSDMVDITEEAPSPKTLSSEQPLTRPIRQPIIPRDKYDGVDSDDETDIEDQEDEESDEEQPQIVGDVEIDMEEEEAEFLEFSKQVLGITDDQWNEIVRDRKDRGAFLPDSASMATSPSVKVTTNREKTKETSNSGGRSTVPLSRANPDLDSFEAVMEALDAELTRHRQSTKSSAPDILGTQKKGKGKATAGNEDEDEDIEAALDAELKASLERDADDDQAEDPPDYNLIKNFLESFKSQAGLSGPVSNLAGRLQPGWQLPRDET